MSRHGRFPAALALLALFAAGVSEGASVAQQAMDRGSKLYEQGRYAQAIEAFQEATRLDPGHLLAWENLGWAYHRAGRHEEAVETWQTVLKVDPARVALLNRIGAIELSRDRPAEAAAALERSLAVDADQPPIRQQLALARERSGRAGEAESYLRGELKRRPGALAAALPLADFLERQERYDEVLALLREVASRRPADASGLNLRLARVEARRGDDAFNRSDYPTAAGAYEEAVRLRPRQAQYLINLGWARRRLGDLPGASAAWTRALEIEPKRHSLYRHIADAELEQENLPAAAALYAEAWSSGREPEVAYRLAEIALREERGSDAVHWLDQLLALKSADESWPRRVAGLFARVEQPDAGARYLAARLEGARHPEGMREGLSRLRALQGSAAYQAGDAAAAAARFEEALRLDPGNTAALRDLGWAEWVAERWDACAEAWQRYAAAHPREPEPHNLLTQLHLKRGAYEDAITSARTSLALDPDQPAEKLRLAKALFWTQRYPEARALGEQLADADPDDLAAQLFWGELLMQYHDFVGGERQWRRVLDLGLRTETAERYWVKSIYEQGDYDRAIAEAERLLMEQGPRLPLLQLLADDAAIRGDDRTARRRQAEIAKHFPQRLPAWLELARLRQQAGDLDGAQRSLSEAARQDPGNVDVALAQVGLDLRAGRTAAAFAASLELHRLHPHQRDVFRRRVDAARAAGRYREALALTRTDRGDFLKPHEARLQEARLLFDLGRDPEPALDAVIDPPPGTRYVPALLYHGLGDHRRTDLLDAARFDAQMRALRQAGYTAITVRELARMVASEQPFPARPILITFDDARQDAFRRADPILERYGMKATMFVPTARIVDDHPFFADWHQIRAWQSSGRWDLQSHGHHAHDPIPVGAQGETGSFLVNRRWLAEDGRLETFDEYRARLDEDHARSIREIEERFPDAEVVGFAYPFSEAGQESAGNEPQATETNRELLTRHFRFGFIQDDDGFNAVRPGEPPTLLRRLSVSRSWTGDDLVRELAEREPLAQALALRGRILFWTGRIDRARETWERIARETPRMQSEVAYYLAAISLQRGRYDTARSHLRSARRLGSRRLAADATLARRIGWQSHPRLQPGIEIARDSAGRESVWQGVELYGGALGPVELSFSAGRISLRDETHEPLEGWLYGAGLGLRPGDHWSFDTRLGQRQLQEADRSLTASAAVGFESDLVSLSLRAGRHDVDTLGAARRGLQAETIDVRLTQSLSRRVSLILNAAAARLDDGNERHDASGRLLFQPSWGGGFRLGVAAGWSDTAFHSDLYYTPEELRWARAQLSFRRGWGAGWVAETELGYGLAVDERPGLRRTAHLSGRAGQAWGPHVRTLLEAHYSRSPGYASWGFGGRLQLGF